MAYSNGANDNFKGVASLFGSGAASYRTALGFATITTFAGSICSIALAQELLTGFSDKGLVPERIVASEYFLFPVALGAGATVILAKLTGFPISTTHALTGADFVGALARISGSAEHRYQPSLRWWWQRWSYPTE